ncbi:MAG: circadian clock protein KaiC [Ktedonobacterales bacterium]
MSGDPPTASSQDAIQSTTIMDPTGIPNLDLILGGGLPRGSLVIVVGPPGSGKTTLANQMAFAAAHAGRRALVLTALSEPTNKLIAHLRTFSFYDERLIGDTLQVLSLQQFLATGLDGTGDEMVAMARQARAGFVVLDGFRGVRGTALDPQLARQFLYDVGTKLGVLGTTTVITSEAEPRDPAYFPESTTADAIVGLYYHLLGVREHRGIEAIKVRGAALLPGLHGLRLSQHGIIVFPRLEARVAAANADAQNGRGEDGQSQHAVTAPVADAQVAVTAPVADAQVAAPAEPEMRATFGLPELDVLLGGGLTRDTCTLVAGNLGTGKTLLALQFAMTGVRAGEPSVYLGFRESQSQLLQRADAFAMGRDLRAALAPGGGLSLLRYAPVELNPDIVADRLVAEIDRMHARRVIVDSIGELERALLRSGDRGRLDDYLAALVEVLRDRQVTTLFTKEISQVTHQKLDFSAEPISVMAENVLLTQQIDHRASLHRVLSVLKMRFSEHDSTLREFTIVAPHGIRVLAPFESDRRMLADVMLEQRGGNSWSPSRDGRPGEPSPRRNRRRRGTAPILDADDETLGGTQ